MPDFIKWLLHRPEDDELDLLWWLFIWAAILAFLGGALSAAVFG